MYVDDILIIGKKNEILDVKDQIKNIYKIKDMGEVDFVIDIKFEKQKNRYILHQKGYIKELIERYNLSNTKPVRNLKPVNEIKNRCKAFNETSYRSIGNLLYLAVCTRPDIIFSVVRASRKSKNPTIEDWHNVKKIFRYLKGTLNYGIKFSNEKILRVFPDADYAGDEETRKSTSGFVMMIGNSPTSWYSKLQHVVVTSTAESKYISVSDCAKHSLWYMNIFKELNIQNKICDYKY